MTRAGRNSQRASANQKSDFVQMNGGVILKLPEEASIKETSKRSILTKTKMCTFFKMGKCKRGSSCTFAHDDSELTESPDLFQTKMCKTVSEGIPCNNPNCRFAHSSDEMRRFHKPEQFGMKSGPIAPHGRVGSTQSMHTDFRKAQKQSAHQFSNEDAFKGEDVCKTEDFLADFSQLIVNALAPALAQAKQTPAEGPVALLQNAFKMLDDMQSASSPQEQEFMSQCIKADIGRAISLLQRVGPVQIETEAVERPQAVSQVGVPFGVWTQSTSGSDMDDDFSRQTSAVEDFESVPAWSRQVSAWGYNPSKGMGRFDADSTEAGYSENSMRLPCEEERSSQAQSSNCSDDGNAAGESEFPGQSPYGSQTNEDEALDIFQPLSMDALPETSFQRQESQQSTSSSIFEMSEAFGLRCSVKNTFFDVDPVESPARTQRVARSISPTLLTREAISDEPLTLDSLPSLEGLVRQTTK